MDAGVEAEADLAFPTGAPAPYQCGAYLDDEKDGDHDPVVTKPPIEATHPALPELSFGQLVSTKPVAPRSPIESAEEDREAARAAELSASEAAPEPTLSEADLVGGFGSEAPPQFAEVVQAIEDPWMAERPDDELSIDDGADSDPTPKEEPTEEPAEEPADRVAADDGETDAAQVDRASDEPVYEIPRREPDQVTEPEVVADPAGEPVEETVDDPVDVEEEPFQAQLFSTSVEDPATLKVAADLVIHSRRANVAFLQRRLHVGYDEAMEVLDALREEGIVGGDIGTPQGSLLVDPAAWDGE